MGIVVLIIADKGKMTACLRIMSSFEETRHIEKWARC